jgi:hypothetical protein
MAVGKLVIEYAAGQALQVAAERASPLDTLYASGTCPALDQYVHRALTIDELHDLQDQLCPTLSEPQRTGN